MEAEGNDDENVAKGDVDDEAEDVVDELRCKSPAANEL